MPRSRNGEAKAKETLLLIKERQRAKLNNATAAEGQPRKNVISGTKKTPPPSPGQTKNTESSPVRKTTPPASPTEIETPKSLTSTRKTPPSSPTINADPSTSLNEKEPSTGPAAGLFSYNHCIVLKSTPSTM